MNLPSEDMPVLGAIDVGTNAARLQIVRADAEGVFESLHYEKASIRPGEGVFESGIMADAVVDRLVDTMQRFKARCERNGARVGAVATSALRDARNAEAVLQRVQTEAGIRLEVISGEEEARLICLGACRGRPSDERALVLDIGGGSTEIALALGGQPERLFSVALGAVRLTEMFASAGEVRPDEIALMRAHAHQELVSAIGPTPLATADVVFGCSGTIRAAAEFATDGRSTDVSAQQLASAVAKLIAMSAAERLERFSAKRADIIVAGAVILEALTETLGLSRIEAIRGGLRSGILVDLYEQVRATA